MVRLNRNPHLLHVGAHFLLVSSEEKNIRPLAI